LSSDGTRIAEADGKPVAVVDAEPIQYEVDGPLARIWLNRPHKRNCVSQQLLAELEAAVDRAEADDRVRAMVIRGRGGTFCSGFDLDELQAEFAGKSTALEIARESARVCDRLFRSDKPSVAVLEGYTTAGGFEIMVNCDFAIAAEDAMIGDFHIRRGLFGGAGPIYRLPRIVGLRKAKELMLTGKLMTGREAVDFGLINDAAPADELDACVDRFVEPLVDKSPYAMTITKMVLNRGLDADTDTLMVLEHLAAGLVLGSDDAQEGISAFLDNREAAWTGK
jgi:enoyl-CoA hydratase/carnithine racemase